MIPLNKIFILLFFAISSIASATNYYVSSSSGSDDELVANGLSTQSPWKTISKINGKTFLPGDSILFKKGDVWRETLIVPSEGTADRYITFGSYGSGQKPRFLGSTKVISWSDQGGNIWKSSTEITNPFTPTNLASEIFFEKQDGSTSWGLHKANLGALLAEYDWTWESNYLYIYSPINPEIRYLSVEAPQRNVVIVIGNREYITIYDLEIKFAKSANIATEYPQENTSGLTIQNCHVGYCGCRQFDESVGFNLSVCRSDLLIKGNEVHDGGRRNTSIHVYGTSGLTFTNLTFDGNIFYEGNHSTGIGCVLDPSSPEINNHFKNIIVRNNLIYDLPTKNPKSDGFDTNEMCTMKGTAQGCSISNIQIYNNIWKYVNQSGIWLDGADNVDVYNNTFYDQNPIITGDNMTHIFITSDCHSIRIKNNIFYTTVAYSQNYSCNNIVLFGLASEVSVDYNLFYQKDPQMGMIVVNGSYYRSTNWANLKNDLGWQSNEPGLVNPLFATNSYYRLQPESPAIGAGVNVGLERDHDGNLYNSDGPSIGAYEGNPIKQPKPIEPNVEMLIYPNPAQIYLNIIKGVPDIEPQIISIFNLAGKIIYTDTWEVGVKSMKIPLNLKSGIYIIQLSYGNLIKTVKKFIVIN